jgi:transcription initiation factor TFIIE subunit alpha
VLKKKTLSTRFSTRKIKKEIKTFKKENSLKQYPGTMKITKELEHQVITAIAGQDTLELVEYLRGKSNISEFIIAEGLKKEINPIRNMLYRLLDANLVSFTRKKDKQKGWYIYYWTYDSANIGHLFWEAKRKRLEFLQENIAKEKNTVFFICPTGCIRIEFDKAFEFDYRCPECGEIILQQDTSLKVSEMQIETDALLAELATREMPKQILANVAPQVKNVKSSTKAKVSKTQEEKKESAIVKTSKLEKKSPLKVQNKSTLTQKKVVKEEKPKNNSSLKSNSKIKVASKITSPNQSKSSKKTISLEKVKKTATPIKNAKPKIKIPMQTKSAAKQTLEKLKQSAAKLASASFF